MTREADKQVLALVKGIWGHHDNKFALVAVSCNVWNGEVSIWCTFFSFSNAWGEGIHKAEGEEGKVWGMYLTAHGLSVHLYNISP